MTVSRRGVSLLEVLISIFVLTIGLLAVAALIPVGAHSVRETVKADNAAACGQAMLSDIKVRGMLNPHTWRSVGTGQVVGVIPGSTSDYHSESRGFLHGESYAIDPMPLSPSTNDVHWNHFPYNADNPGVPFLGEVPFARWTRMQRVSWTDLDVNPLLTRTVFGWHDDLIIQVPSDETQRPRQLFVTYNGGIDAREFPIVPAPSSGNPLALHPDNMGNYSWLATVTPAAESHGFVHTLSSSGHPADGLPYSYSSNTPVYTVSVVVFYKRDMTPPDEYTSTEAPAERQVTLEWLGSGLGGGDARLYAPLKPVDEPQLPQYLDVKKNEWMMVSGGFGYPYTFIHPIDGPTGVRGVNFPIGVHKWYRIVAAGEIVNEDLNGNGVIDAPFEQDYNVIGGPPYEYFREVTLAGPDWNPRWGDWGGLPPTPGNPLGLDGEPDHVLATLLKGVIGVYTTTVDLD